MTDNENQQEARPEAKKKKKRVRPPKPWMIVMFAAFMIASLMIIIALKSLRSDPEMPGGGTRTDAMSAPEDTVAGGKATQAYQERIEAENEMRAEEAGQEGRSFVPVTVQSGDEFNLEDDEALLVPQRQEWTPPDPEFTKEDLDELRKLIFALRSDLENTRNDLYREIERQVKKQQDSRQYQQVEETRRQTEANIEILTERYSNQMQQIAGTVRSEVGGQQVVNFDNEPPETPSPRQEQESESSNDNTKNAEIDLAPGDILYARNELLLNSDAPGPVQATVLSREMQGAKLLGQFGKQGDYLVVEFNRLITTDGEVYNIKGVAIDPAVPTTAVRSGINRRLLQRWGGLMAASFLAGFGEAVQSSGSQLSVSDGQTIQGTPELSTEQELWAAGGRVGSRLEAQFERNFSRPATVTLDPDMEIGVLILEVR